MSHRPHQRGTNFFFFWQALKGLYALSSIVIHFESAVNRTAEEIKMFFPIMKFLLRQSEVTDREMSQSKRRYKPACNRHKQARENTSEKATIGQFAFNSYWLRISCDRFAMENREEYSLIRRKHRIVMWKKKL